MPKLKKTERKKKWGDPEGSPSGGTGVLRASTSTSGDGLGGMRPEEEGDGGGSSEASGRRLSCITDFGLTGGPYTQEPRDREASTGGTGTVVVASDVEQIGVHSGRERSAHDSGFIVLCQWEGCGKAFTRKDNAERHSVRFHFHYLDGTPAPPELIAKLTGRVKDSDRRRLEAKHLATASSGVGRPRRKARSCLLYTSDAADE